MIESSILFHGPFRYEDIQLQRVEGTRQYPPLITALIETTWKAEKAKQDRFLFNGAIVSLLDVKRVSNALFCTIQETDYQAFVGTNLHHCNDISDKDMMANPIAVCAVLLTADQKLVIGKRSTKLAESSGYYHVPGGTLEFGDIIHPESTIRKELEEEFGIIAPDLEDITCMALAMNHVMHKPEFLYYAKLKLTADALQTRYLTASDAEEHTEICYIQSDALPKFIQTHPMTVIGKAALLLWFEKYRGQNE